MSDMFWSMRRSSPSARRASGVPAEHKVECVADFDAYQEQQDRLNGQFTMQVAMFCVLFFVC